MQVTNLGYLEDKTPCFPELLDSSTKKLNRMLVRLDIAVIILKINDQDPPNLIDLEAEQVNKKKEKAKRYWQRKMNLT